MRIMKAVLVAAVLVTTATAAHAANMTFGLRGDAAIPVGTLADDVKLGFGGGVYGDYWIKDDYAFGVDVNGHFFSAKTDLIDQIKAASGAGYQDPKLTSTLISVCAHGMWAPAMKDAPAQPWVTYGAGMYRISSKVEGVDPAVGANGTDNVNKFGFNLGAGADMKAGTSMKVGVHVKYHYVLEGTVDKNDKKVAASFVTAGVNLTFLTSGAK